MDRDSLVRRNDERRPRRERRARHGNVDRGVGVARSEVVRGADVDDRRPVVGRDPLERIGRADEGAAVELHDPLHVRGPQVRVA